LNFKIDIGSKEYNINDRFTLIHGDIEKNKLSNYSNNQIKECLNQLNVINLEKFIEIFTKSTKNYANLDSALKLIEYLIIYSKNSKFNSEIVKSLYSLIQSFQNLVKFNNYQQKKTKLLKELEKSKIYEKQSTISTITELIDDLEENIRKSKKKLSYFEEDYLNRKNQFESINKLVSDYRAQISKLNEEKKSYFSEINSIMREMEKSVNKKPDRTFNVEGMQELSNSERIKHLQGKARETQYNINQLRKKINEKLAQIKQLEPQFRVFEKDHNKLISIIQNDKARVKELKEKLKVEINNNQKNFILENQNAEEINLKSEKEIKLELNRIDRELNQITLPKEYFNPDNPADFSKIQKRLSEIKDIAKSKSNHMQIDINKEEISDVIKYFEILDNIIYDLENNLNQFLQKINLNSQFFITVEENRKELFLEIIFTRNEKEKLNFEDLTTPEKVFVAVTFYISLELIKKSRNIIFSNLFIPDHFNKRGSIERTLKKILPVFESEEKLLDKKVVFIISNLEIKSKIKNLKLIKIKGS
jgi:DNA repair exonuclease SbcCD ATPase subunit